MKKIVVAAIMIISLSSAHATIKIENIAPTGTKERSVKIYSGYSKGQYVVEVTAESADYDQADFTIINLEGNIVYKGKLTGSTTKIALNDTLKPGTYMLQVNAGSIQKTKRLVIR